MPAWNKNSLRCALQLVPSCRETLDQGHNGYATAAADLMKSVTGLHPEMTALYVESARGQYRGRAARRVAAALVLEIEAAYALTLFLVG